MKDHPNDEQLIAYAGDELNRADATVVPDHVVSCARCAGTVARYRMVRDLVRVDEADVPPVATLARAKALFSAPTPFPARDRLAPLRRIIAELVFDSGAGLNPALAGFRGGGERHLTYEAEAIEIDLQLQPPAAQGGAWRLLGQIAAEPEAPTVLEILPAGEDAPVSAARADEYGMFQLSAPARRYDVVARFPDKLVILPGLEIG